MAAAAAPPATPPPARDRSAFRELVTGQALALLAAFAFAGLVGAAIIIAYGESPLKVYDTIWRFSTARPKEFAAVLTNATPLIFSGLAVAVAFKAGMFNIGVEGQYIVGMVTATIAALTLDFLPAVLLLPAVMLAAMAGSMIWAFIPAFLKVKTGAHEVVTTIMMNGIAVSFAAYMLLEHLRTKQQGLIDLRTDLFADAARVPALAPTLGLEDQIPRSVHLTWLFPLGLVAAGLVWWFLYRTRLGYEVRAVGSSAGSAESGGISIGAAQIKVFLISGALAGFVGLQYLLGVRGYLGHNYETQLGFTGIGVAFLGRNHPVGIVLAAILMGMLAQGEVGIQILTDVPREIIIILQGVLILSVVVAFGISRRIVMRRRQQAHGERAAAPGPAEAEA
jgi:simple sugar transport system permease protein